MPTDSISPVPLSKKLWRRAFSPRGIRRFQFGAAIGLMVGLVFSAAILLGTLKQFESGLADWFYRPLQPSGNIVLIAIDDQTADEYGLPIERIVQRGFINNVARFQPRVIVLDFIMPDLGSPVEDEALAVILRRSNKLVQPVLGVEGTRYPLETSPFPAFDSVIAPALVLRTPNTTLAHTMLYPDADGVTRRVSLAIDAPEQRYPAMAIAAVALFEGTEPKVGIRKNEVLVGNRHIPVDDQGQMLINFVQRDTIKTRSVSYADIVQGKADYNQLRDKIVLVGPINKAVSENYAVPASVNTAHAYNIQIQADVIETLLSGKYLREEERPAQILAVLVIAALAGITLPRLSWLYGAVVSLGYLAAYLLYAYTRADNGVIVTPLYTILALVTTYALAVIYRYFSEERARASISRIFQGRVAPGTISKVIDLYDQGTLSLAGGRRQVTVLCATFRGIASLSEATAPEAVIELLDRYSTTIIETIFRMGGAVTSQIGNTVSATWNFPLAQADHAERALTAAFEIQRQVSQRRFAVPDESEVGVAIGIATGVVVVGHLSSLQTDFSIVGEVVTLSERITALAAPSQVLISTETRAVISNDWDTRHIHSLRTRGKKDPILVWEAGARPQI